MNFNLPISKKIADTAQTFERVRDAVIEALDDEAKKVLAYIRQEMRSPKSGKMRSGIRASAPGEAPAVRTKRLINSLRARKSQGGLKIRITAEVAHAKLLEEGTPRGMIKARPFMAPAEKHFEPLIKARLESVVAQQIKRRAR